MKLKKGLEIIRIIGSLLSIGYFLASLIIYGNLNGFKDNDTLRCLLYIGVLMLLPLNIYKMIHFKEYRKENIGNLIFLAIFIFIVIYVISFR